MASNRKAAPAPDPDAADDGFIFKNYFSMLHLKPTELVIFGLVLSFSADGAGAYTAGSAYAALRAGVTQRTAQAAIARLLRDGYLLEVGEHVQGDNTAGRRLQANPEVVRRARRDWRRACEEALGGAPLNGGGAAPTAEAPDATEADASGGPAAKAAEADAGERGRGIPGRREAGAARVAPDSPELSVRLAELCATARNRRSIGRTMRPYAELVNGGITCDEIDEAWARRQADAELTATDDTYFPNLAKWLGDPGHSGCRAMVGAARAAAGRRADGGVPGGHAYTLETAYSGGRPEAIVVKRDGRILGPLMGAGGRIVPPGAPRAEIDAAMRARYGLGATA